MNKLLNTLEVQNLLLDVMIDFDQFCRENNLPYYLIGGSLLGAVRHQGFIPWDDDMDVGMIRDDYERFLSLIDQNPLDYEIKNFRNSKYCDYVITRIYIDNTFIDNKKVLNKKLDSRLYFDIFPLDYVPDELEEAKNHAQKIMRQKKYLSYVDAKNFNNKAFVVFVKRVFAFFLSPFRHLIIQKLENEMRKFQNTKHLCSLASQYSYKKQYFSSDIYGKPKEYEFCNHRFLGPEKPVEYLSQLYGNDYMDLPPVEKRRSGWDIYYCE